MPADSCIVDQVAEKHGTEDVAEEYLNYLYSDEAQEIEAKNYYRPSTESVYKEYVSENAGSTVTSIPEDGKWINDQVELTNIEHFGGWTEAVQSISQTAHILTRSMSSKEGGQRRRGSALPFAERGSL